MSGPIKVRGRIIAASTLGKIDDIVEIDENQVAGLHGQVDCDPSAVAYAESLQAAKKQHQDDGELA